MTWNLRVLHRMFCRTKGDGKGGAGQKKISLGKSVGSERSHDRQKGRGETPTGRPGALSKIARSCKAANRGLLRARVRNSKKNRN